VSYSSFGPAESTYAFRSFRVQSCIFVQRISSTPVHCSVSMIYPSRSRGLRRPTVAEADRPTSSVFDDDVCPPRQSLLRYFSSTHLPHAFFTLCFRTGTDRQDHKFQKTDVFSSRCRGRTQREFTGFNLSSIFRFSSVRVCVCVCVYVCRNNNNNNKLTRQFIFSDIS